MSTEYFHDELQEQIVRKLRAAPALAGLDVIHEDEKDLLNQINLSLKKLGLCIVVTAPVENCTMTELPAPVFDSVKIAVNVAENVLINRSASGTQQPCKRVAKLVLAALWHYRPPDFGGACYPDKPAIQNIPDANYVVYRVNIKIGE